MDAVRRDHHVALRDRAVREAHSRNVAVLRKAARAMAGVHDAGRQGARQDVDEIRAMHAEGGVPAGGVRDLHRRDLRAVVAQIARVAADARAYVLDRPGEPDAPELAHTVGSEKHAGANFADCRCLLIERDVEPVRAKRIGREQAADPAPDDDDVER